MATAMSFRTPEMNWDANDLADELAKFKQYCNLIFTGPFSKKSEKEQASFILLWIGRQGIECFNSWTRANNEDKEKPGKIWERFEKYVAPKVNHRLLRFQLQQFKQKSEELIDDFLSRCRNQSTKCKFSNTTESDERLIEQTTISTKHKKIQERLLSKGKSLTLDEAIDVCKTYEATLSQLDQLNSESEKSINAVKGDNLNRGARGDTSKSKKCPNCGGDHPQSRDKCPAYGSECKSCGKANHWARVCRSKPQPQRESRSRRRENPRARARSKTTDRQTRSQPPTPRALSDQFETITFGAMTVNSIESARDEVFASVNIKLRSDDNCQTALRAKLDTGAQENLLPLRVIDECIHKTSPPKAIPSQIYLQNRQQSCQHMVAHSSLSTEYAKSHVNLMERNQLHHSLSRKLKVQPLSDCRHH